MILVIRRMVDNKEIILAQRLQIPISLVAQANLIITHSIPQTTKASITIHLIKITINHFKTNFRILIMDNPITQLPHPIMVHHLTQAIITTKQTNSLNLNNTNPHMVHIIHLHNTKQHLITI